MGIVTAWTAFSPAQKVGACVTLVLMVGAFLYVPYYVPTTRSYEYSWIWQPVKYQDPLTEKILDQVDTDQLRKQGIAIDPNWKENSKRPASWSLWRADRNAALILLVGIVMHFAIGAVDQLRMSKSQDTANTA
jgi:hypothetical protein